MTIMGLRVLVATALLLLSLDVATAAASEKQDVLDKHMSTKTKYPTPTLAEEIETRAREEAEAAALQCRPVQLNYVVRHGTRFPTIKDIRRIDSVHRKLLLHQRDADIAWLHNWTNPYDPEHAGWLAPIGVDELIDIGARLRRRFGASFRRHFNASAFVFESTWKVRTQQSASAFAYGFFDERHEPVHVGIAPIGADHELRFFDNCPAYDRAIDDNATATIHYADYRTSHQMQQNVLAFRERTGTAHVQTEPLTRSDMEAAYAACAFDVAIFSRYDRWCALFTREMLLSMDYYHDLKHFYKKSHGHALAFEIAAPLLQDVFESMRARVMRAAHVDGHFRFAHAETILPLASLLDLSYFDRHASDAAGHFLATTPLDVAITRAFHASTLAPFAANIGFVLYECDGDDDDAPAYRVATLLHERQVAFRACGNATLCPFEQFEQIFRRWLHEVDFHDQCA